MWGEGLELFNYQLGNISHIHIQRIQKNTKTTWWPGTMRLWLKEFSWTNFLLWLFSSSRKRFNFLKIKLPKVIPDTCNYFFSFALKMLQIWFQSPHHIYIWTLWGGEGFQAHFYKCEKWGPKFFSDFLWVTQKTCYCCPVTKSCPILCDRMDIRWD